LHSVKRDKWQKTIKNEKLKIKNLRICVKSSNFVAAIGLNDQKVLMK
jgi:hypothetical protein